MVQSKVPDKLDIKVDHGKSFKLSVNLKPSSPRLHDRKGRGGTDLMKMTVMMVATMRSGSIERPDHNGFRSPTSLRKARKEPGKALPHQLVAAAAGESPQKKQSPARAPEPSPNYMKSTSSSDARIGRLQVDKTPGKSLHKETSAAFDRSASRMPLRMSSMKLMRTLTKTSSFKPTRLVKRCPPAILCKGVEFQRPTCSSTLKGSKFPNYLELNPGGTELEGTSILKVCPYTYCSLNGHHCALLPTLKTFLMVKRRSLKAQTSFNLDCSSPRGIKPSQGVTKETDIKLASNSSSQDANINFFIEIYSKDDSSKQQVDDREAVVHETIGSENYNCRLDGIEISTEMETAEFRLDDLVEEVPGTVSLGITANDVSDSEANDMEWDEAGKGSAYCFYDVQFLESLETNGYTIQEEENLCSDDTGKSSLEEIVASEVQQDLYDEKSLNSEAWSEDGESKTDKSQKYMERDEPLTVSPMCDAFEADDNMGTKSTRDTTEDIDERANATADEDEFAISEAKNEIQGTAMQQDGDKEQVVSENHEENGHPIEDYVSGSLNNQGFETSNNFPKQGPDVSDKDQAASRSTQVFKVVLVGDLSNEYIYGYSVPKSRNLETNQASLEHSLLNSGTRYEIEADKYDAAKSLIPDHFELEQDTTNEDNKEGNVAPITTGSELHKIFAAEDISCNTRSDTMKEQFEKIEVNCHDTPQKDQDNTAQDISATEKGYEDQPKEQLAISDSNKRNLLVHTSGDHVEELLSSCKKLRGIVRNKKRTEELEDLREFNPREPNYLPLEPDPERERVDLKHQMMDDRKNSDEWMMDFALRQTVNKLASARKKKVALLVEAFEKVTPVSKYEAHLRHTSDVFAHARPMQACS